ncbi:hypothetical protein ATO6_19760 [Oceanicola sp. 22II-s10i]|nr:hypothetical protein ATO6_19760 [Oceanicola sp. 22II-s10i]
MRSHGWRDCMLHALAIGAGMDPAAEHDHHLLDEARMRTAPDMVSAILDPAQWHAGVTSLVWHEVTWHAPVPVEAELRRHSRILASDALSGGMSRLEVEHRVDHLGRTLATARQVVMAGAATGRQNLRQTEAPVMPDRAPDHVVEAATQPQMALIHVETGGGQPMNFDPAAARAADLDRPVLQDLAIAGVARRALADALCQGRPDAVGTQRVRFAGHAVPGDTLRTEIWLDGATAIYRTCVAGGAPVCDGTFRRSGSAANEEGKTT